MTENQGTLRIFYDLFCLRYESLAEHNIHHGNHLSNLLFRQYRLFDSGIHSLPYSFVLQIRYAITRTMIILFLDLFLTMEIR